MGHKTSKQPVRIARECGEGTLGFTARMTSLDSLPFAHNETHLVPLSRCFVKTVWRER